MPDTARAVLSKCYLAITLIYGQRHGSRLAHAAGGSGDGQVCRALLDLAVVAASRKSQQDNDRGHHPQPGLQTASPKQAYQQ